MVVGFFSLFLSADYGVNPAEINCLPNFQLVVIGEMNPVLKFQLLEF